MTTIRHPALVLLIVLLGHTRARAEVSFSCATRLETARSALLAAHFDPANDTATWLQVRLVDDTDIMLNIFTEYSPDGDGYRTFEAEIQPVKGHKSTTKADKVTKPTRWRLVAQRVLDEFKEERLPERTWTRIEHGWVATIHTRTEDREFVTLFESIAKSALDECLAHPGAITSTIQRTPRSGRPPSNIRGQGPEFGGRYETRPTPTTRRH